MFEMVSSIIQQHYLQAAIAPVFPFTYSSSSTRSRRRKRNQFIPSCLSTTSSLSSMDDKFMEFPYLSTPHRNLMLDLVSTMETRLSDHLLPCSLPQDVKFFENDTATSQGTLHIRSGIDDSPVDFILGSWIHSKLPMGALNITTLTAYLNKTTDAPRFLLEFIQSSPTSLILILDLPHRKDLILYPNYLNTFYMDTQLDQFRQQLNKLSETKPYFSASLYIRCALSPTAVSVVIDCGTDGQGRMDEIISDHIGPVAKEMLEIWLDKCACGGRAMEEQERVDLKKRDALVNKKTLDIDLASGLPRLFGPDVASRVIQGIEKYFIS